MAIPAYAPPFPLLFSHGRFPIFLALPIRSYLLCSFFRLLFVQVPSHQVAVGYYIVLVALARLLACWVVVVGTQDVA